MLGPHSPKDASPRRLLGTLGSPRASPGSRPRGDGRGVGCKTRVGSDHSFKAAATTSFSPGPRHLARLPGHAPLTLLANHEAASAEVPPPPPAAANPRPPGRKATPPHSLFPARRRVPPRGSLGRNASLRSAPLRSAEQYWRACWLDACAVAAGADEWKATPPSVRACALRFHRREVARSWEFCGAASPLAFILAVFISPIRSRECSSAKTPFPGGCRVQQPGPEAATDFRCLAGNMLFRGKCRN